YYSRNVIGNGSGWAVVRKVTPQESETFIGPDGTEIDNPIYLNKTVVDNAIAGQTGSRSNIKNSVYSAYASDVINFTPALSAMASLRMDYFDSKAGLTASDEDYDQLVFSPKFGLVY